MASLKEKGFTITPVAGATDGFIFEVTEPQRKFYIKRTSHGKLRAYRSKDAKVDSTIAGLYNFVEQNGDLHGEPLPKPQAKQVDATAVPTAPAVA